MPLIEMRGITKRFGELVANDRIDLDLEHQEIHALLGENGAGKTTLMKILYGMYQPDEGHIYVGDQLVKLRSPAQAIAHKIGFVSQHFSLVPTFTVAENIVLGQEGGAILDQDQINQTVRALAGQYDFQIDPTATIRDLSVGEQQRVEILKALYRQCRVLILDEPTAVLTPHDRENLFRSLRRLQEQHLSVVIITHKLEEVVDISQRVTVLRRGQVVGREQTRDTNSQELARLMVGRNTLLVTRNVDHKVSDNTVLEASHLKLTDKRGVATLRDLSFSVMHGEIVGLAGVAGNGQSELVDVISGMVAPDSGEVLVNGQSLKLGDPREPYRMKVGRIPEDRLKGIVGDLTVAQNLALEHIDTFTYRGHLDKGKITETARQLIEEFQIKASAGDRVRTLSGGNIQKIILARTLSREPSIVIAAQPTRGLDIGATEYVHQKLLEQKERGAGVLLVSDDLDEILLLSDRILVMYEGQLVGEFQSEEADIDQISLLMTGSAITPVSPTEGP